MLVASALNQADLKEAIGRLEQVTERLLRFEASLGRPGGVAAGGAAAGAAAGGTAAAAAAVGTGAGDYDRLLSEQLQPLMALANSLGGEILEASKLVERAFLEQGKVLQVAAKAKQPDASQLQGMLQPVAAPMMAAAGLADNRRSPSFQQLKMVAEALQGLSWLAYTGPACGLHVPAQHVAESWNAAEFYTNKLLKEFRGVDDRQVDWAKALKELFTGLQTFVSVAHPGGLRWNPSGCSFAEAQAAVGPAAAAVAPAAAAAAPAKAQAKAAAPAAPKPPPPPPPPPAPGQLLADLHAANGSAQHANGDGGGGGMQDVLKSLKQGGAVTSGLRKVTDDMKAKNRADRSGHVGAAPPARKPAAPGAGAGAPSGPPKLELQQERKWVVENQVDQQDLVVTVADPKHSVYIFNCTGSVVQIKGKCNAISIDKCRKTGVVYEDVIASCELVNCSSVQVQCTGTVPTVSVDKCDGVQAYVPAAVAANRDFQVVTAKSSEVNVLVLSAPGGEGEGEEEGGGQQDVAEHAVPEQFISTFVGGRLVTVAASHGGG